MPRSISDTRSYHYLTIEDVLQAQQIFHSDLFDRDNVVATAVGKYRERRDKTQPRTLRNSCVVNDRSTPSWPALLVFVAKWYDKEYFRHEDRWEDFVPSYVALPDRRRVPTCVILVEEANVAPPPLYQRLNFPTWMIGGGFPVVRRAQEQDRAGSLGCLVTDGANVFALTNRHVAGPAGSLIETFVAGQRQRIGVSHAKQFLKLNVDDAFPGFSAAAGWKSAVTYTNIDAGLIEVDDVNAWTAQIYGLGELGDLYDLSADTISLDLIGQKVCAFGAASGELHGEVQGFFYRYKTVGAFGYVSDLLIGPAGDEPLQTVPGDSGTLWCLADEGKQQLSRAAQRRPIALQWGGHTFGGGGEQRYQLALATSLSTILRALDVDIITDWNTGHTEYWGKIGHYKVAATACALANGTSAFDRFIRANASNIAFGDVEIEKGEVSAAKSGFVPLADVADIVWRSSRGLDSSNHFADMDQAPTKGKFRGKTLLDLTRGGRNIDAATWVEFYESLEVKPKYMGALPFRIWQMFDEAVGYLTKQKAEPDRFLAAIGLMAHYVGDACQPLHVSFLHHGREGHPGEDKVHSVYETIMIDRFTLDLVQKVNAVNRSALPLVNNGFEAAKAIIELMRRTVRTLSPIEVIEAYNDTPGRGRTRRMWELLGARTAQCMADGARTLYMLWESAFQLGRGSRLRNLGAIAPSRLKELYETKTFVESRRLPDMVAMLTPPPAATRKRLSVRDAQTPATAATKAVRRRAPARPS